MIEKNSLRYEACILRDKLEQLHSCDYCDERVTTKDSIRRTRHNSPTASNPSAKPSRIFINFVQKIENVFKASFEEHFDKSKIFEILFQKVSAIPHFFCDEFPNNEFLVFFIRLRIYTTILFFNRQLKDTSRDKAQGLKIFDIC